MVSEREQQETRGCRGQSFSVTASSSVVSRGGRQIGFLLQKQSFYLQKKKPQLSFPKGLWKKNPQCGGSGQPGTARAPISEASSVALLQHSVGYNCPKNQGSEGQSRPGARSSWVLRGGTVSFLARTEWWLQSSVQAA